MKVANLLILAACGSYAIAQQSVGETDVYYDSGRNVVYSVGSISADYNTQYWYTTWIYTAMFNGGSYAGYDSEPTSTYVETSGTPGYEVVADSTYQLNIEYETYQVDPSCYSDCYTWYDSYGYYLLDNGGDPSGGGGQTIWVWTAPVIVATITFQTAVDQQGGGRYRVPGPPATFDVRLRSFIPPLYVTGPEPYCIPYTYKKSSTTEIIGTSIPGQHPTKGIKW